MLNLRDVRSASHQKNNISIHSYYLFSLFPITTGFILGLFPVDAPTCVGVGLPIAARIFVYAISGSMLYFDRYFSLLKLAPIASLYIGSPPIGMILPDGRVHSKLVGRMQPSHSFGFSGSGVSTIFTHPHCWQIHLDSLVVFFAAIFNTSVFSLGDILSSIDVWFLVNLWWIVA